MRSCRTLQKHLPSLVLVADLIFVEAKLLHFELQGHLSDVVDEEGERCHEAKRGQVHESQGSCRAPDLRL